MAETKTQSGSDAQGSIRTHSGYVVSDRMDKTAVVVFERRTKHSLYKKYIRRSTRIKVHDPENNARVGDFVEVSDSRPRSRDKSWMLIRVIERANQIEG